MKRVHILIPKLKTRLFQWDSRGQYKKFRRGNCWGGEVCLCVYCPTANGPYIPEVGHWNDSCTVTRLWTVFLFPFTAENIGPKKTQTVDKHAMTYDGRMPRSQPAYNGRGDHQNVPNIWLRAPIGLRLVAFWCCSIAFTPLMSRCPLTCPTMVGA